jgi:hypothetical protein
MNLSCYIYLIPKSNHSYFDRDQTGRFTYEEPAAWCKLFDVYLGMRSQCSIDVLLYSLFQNILQSAFKSICNTLHAHLIFLPVIPPNPFNISINSMLSFVSNDLLNMVMYCFRYIIIVANTVSEFTRCNRLR